MPQYRQEALREALTCHRGLLIAPCLVARGQRVVHILGDGRLEDHEALEDRLVAASGQPADDLFNDRAERWRQAYRWYG